MTQTILTVREIAELVHGSEFAVKHAIQRGRLRSRVENGRRGATLSDVQAWHARHQLAKANHPWRRSGKFGPVESSVEVGV